MHMKTALNQFDHPSWFSVVGVGVGYLLILVLMTIALFVVPWIVFALL